MWDAVLDVGISGGSFIAALLGVTGVLLALVVVRRPRKRWSTGRWLGAVSAAALVGGGIGWLITWLVSEVWDVFGVGLTTAVHLTVALSFAGIAIGTLAVFRRGAWRRFCAILLVVAAVISGAAIINVDFGQFHTLRQALGLTRYSNAPLPSATKNGSADALNLLSGWTAPANMPAKGEIRTVTIPATTSHFPARAALVYLPPAALIANPPLLPVVVVLAGQPGSPADVFVAGHLGTLMDALAAKHGGVAPILVVPDQLSAPELNPMCVASALGNSASYLTVDVPNWIRSNLNVIDAREQWALAGFSQGGTCAVQLGAAHPDIFGSFVAVSAELGPTLGNEAITIQRGFNGSSTAYAAAQPIAIMQRNAPYADTVAVFSVGQNDARYRPYTDQLEAAATAAGIASSLDVAPGTGHDWYTGSYGLNAGIGAILGRLGIGGAHG